MAQYHRHSLTGRNGLSFPAGVDCRTAASCRSCQRALSSRQPDDLQLLASGLCQWRRVRDDADERMNLMHPYLTGTVPGTGGTIKETPGDFIVEEIPSYLPCGSGEHCYLTIEKYGITTLEAIRRIAQSLNLHRQGQRTGFHGLFPPDI